MHGPGLKRDLLHKALNRSFGQALHRFDMIADGDRILVGVSGGRDSLTLLWMLRARLRWIPLHYELLAAYLDPGFGGGFAPALQDYCRRMGVALLAEQTDFGVRAHSDENRENPCFLCSRLRRQRLFELADANGCAKIALGHNKDDFIETFLINIFYAGEVAAMQPVQDFFAGRFTVIRPLVFTGERLIDRFAAAERLPNLDNPCPSAENSKRREIRDLLKRLHGGNKNIRGNLFRALSANLGSSKGVGGDRRAEPEPGRRRSSKV